MNEKAATATTQKDKGILLEITNKTREEIFRPAITKLLHTYMTFIINSPDFFLASLKEIVICKNNSIRVFLNPSFNIPIFSSWSGRLNELF